MNELTMSEKMVLAGLLGVAYDRKSMLIRDLPHVEPYVQYLQKDMEDIKSICDKLMLDIDLPEKVESV